MTAKTDAERQEARRARRRAEGLTRVEVFAHPDDHPAIKTLAAELRLRRLTPGPAGPGPRR